MDHDSGQPVVDGANASMGCTCLYKDGICAIISFNPHDFLRADGVWIKGPSGHSPHDAAVPKTQTDFTALANAV